MTGATHYIEQYRGKNSSRLISLPPKEISNLAASLDLTETCDCVTIAIFKIKYKPGCEPKSIENAE